MIPVVYWLVFFSIIVHGLSIPILNGIYRLLRVAAIQDHPVDVMLLSENEPIPNNSVAHREDHSVTVNNRFSCISHQSQVVRGDQELNMIRLRPSQSNSNEVTISRITSKQSSDHFEQAREMV